MPDAPTPEMLRALEARLRQLFADLGVPADEAVELRADELAALLGPAPRMSKPKQHRPEDDAGRGL